MSRIDGKGGEEQATVRRLTWLRRSVAAVLLAGVLAFLVEGADEPADPVLVPAEQSAQARSGEAGAPVVGAGSTPTDDGSGTTTTSTTTGPAAPSTDPPATTVVPAPAGRSAPSPTTAAPPPPTGTSPVTTVAAPARRPLSGFEDVAFRIQRPGGSTFDGLAMLADDPISRAQGLMEQTDLRGYDGMVFRNERPHRGWFYMRNTRIPLSIAFFDTGGRFVSSAEMAPCPDEVDSCPRYYPEGPYVDAIEVASGDLPRMGIGPGSVLSFPSP